ncbi:MAG: hypothetical protein SVG88_09820 [Halobacteriales archaeon]|nr:hypothetical protein [Halobacteriales archaeon]
MVPAAIQLGDPVLLGLLAALVVFFFFIYLFIRRIVAGFREGYEGGRSR